jgi:hypothetical protein
MQDNEEGRRAFVRRGALTFLAVMAGPAVLSACGGSGPDCNAGATDDQLIARSGAHYLDNAHNPARSCSICSFFTAGAEGQCAPCALNMGNVNPQGSCDRFAERG